MAKCILSKIHSTKNEVWFSEILLNTTKQHSWLFEKQFQTSAARKRALANARHPRYKLTKQTGIQGPCVSILCWCVCVCEGQPAASFPGHWQRGRIRCAAPASLFAWRSRMPWTHANQCLLSNWHFISNLRWIPYVRKAFVLFLSYT